MTVNKGRTHLMPIICASAYAYLLFLSQSFTALVSEDRFDESAPARSFSSARRTLCVMWRRVARALFLRCEKNPATIRAAIQPTSCSLRLLHPTLYISEQRRTQRESSRRFAAEKCPPGGERWEEVQDRRTAAPTGCRCCCQDAGHNNREPQRQEAVRASDAARFRTDRILSRRRTRGWVELFEFFIFRRRI